VRNGLQFNVKCCNVGSSKTRHAFFGAAISKWHAAMSCVGTVGQCGCNSVEVCDLAGVNVGDGNAHAAGNVCDDNVDADVIDAGFCNWVGYGAAAAMTMSIESMLMSVMSVLATGSGNGNGWAVSSARSTDVAVLL